MRLDIQPTDSLSLESNLERLALEAEFLDNLIEHFQQTLPKLSSLLVSVSASFTTDIDKKALKELKSLQLTNRKKIKELTLTDIGGTLVQIPANFTGELVNYIPLLSAINSDSYIMGVDALGEFSLLLSSFINNKEDKTTLSDKTKSFKLLDEARLSFIDKIEAYKSKKVKSDKVALNLVVNRVKDIEELTTKTTALVAIIDKQDIRALVDEVAKISSLLSMVEKAISDKTTEKVSGAAAKNIAESVYSIAKFMELIAVLRHRSNEVIGSVKDINKIVEKI